MERRDEPGLTVMPPFEMETVRETTMRPPGKGVQDDPIRPDGPAVPTDTNATAALEAISELEREEAARKPGKRVPVVFQEWCMTDEAREVAALLESSAVAGLRAMAERALSGDGAAVSAALKTSYAIRSSRKARLEGPHGRKRRD